MSSQSDQRKPGSKPQSIKIEPWTDHPRQAYSIHGDDFCHTKPFVAKFTAKGQKSTLNIKQTLTKKDGKLNVEDQVKLWFDLPNNHSIYTKVKSTNYIKLHYDHGLCECKHGSKWNFYGSFWTDKALSKSSVRLGVASYTQKCESDNRIRVDNHSGAHTLHWYHRTFAKHNNIGLGLVTVVDLTNRVLQKNNILLRYTHQTKHQGFLRLENDSFRKNNPDWANCRTIWDNLIANYFVKADSNTKVGLEAKFNLADNKVSRIEAVIQKVIPQQKATLKVRVNNNQEAAILLKRPLWGFEDLATLSLGGAIHHALTQKRSFSHGIQLDINI